MSEKCLNLMEEIVNFKAEGGIENTADKFGKMMAEVKKMDLAANLNFALTLQFMERLEKSGKLSSDEKMRLKDEIETKEGKPKYIDSDERVQKELRRMKIVNDRENIWDVKLTDTYFVRERERADMENGKTRWRKMVTGDLTLGKDIGRMEQQPQ